MLNFTPERAAELRKSIGAPPMEFWPIIDGALDASKIRTFVEPTVADPADWITLPRCEEPELAVYVEQIAASLATLWPAYSTYSPDELRTIRSAASITDALLKQYASVKRAGTADGGDVTAQKRGNAIVSALVELSAALSYAVTQGTSGATPILWNRSPFPHHSLLGIGTAVRALSKFTRYLEFAFQVRSAGKVIESHYTEVKHAVPGSIAKYDSGAEYVLPLRSPNGKEHFDKGGDFPNADDMPLITHFSLRHGFMESKFCVTAASEALTAETMPQWTLMTLSHEIMHSRVRSIFQALFGTTWIDQEQAILSKVHFEAFKHFVQNRKNPVEIPVSDGLRNVILNFCYALHCVDNPTAPDNNVTPFISLEKLAEVYSRYKQLAIEMVVHFHDFYFTYAHQRKMYLMSLWASWIRVAAPFTRPREYLIRSLATVASGSGLPTEAAFNYAIETLSEALDSLSVAAEESPLFSLLRQLTSDESQRKQTYAYFKPFYYLADQIRLFFASPLIAGRIERIEEDPFAEGSSDSNDYTASVYVFADEDCLTVSPVQYALASLCRSLRGDNSVPDAQWLTAWNYMVISSQNAQC